MAKISLDVDKITNEYSLMLNSKLENITRAKECASKVSISSDNYDWNSIYTKIGDCVESTQKYITWLNETVDKYKSSFNTSTDTISKITVEQVRECKLIVK